MAFWLYMLRCADGAFYIGHTDNLEQRIAQHESGAIPGCFTLNRRPVELVYSQDFASREEALASERQIKGWRRAKKEALIAGQFERLPALAKTAAVRGSTGSPRTEGVSAEQSCMSGTQYAVRGEPVELRTAAQPRTTEDDYAWMRHALALADRAETEHDEVPVGAVIVSAAGEVLGEGWNRNIREHDPSAHAEIVALREAGRRRGNHRLVDTTLYVTLEPCAMCAMALVHARVARVVYAAADPKTGACGSVFDLILDPRHNHRIEVVGGVLADEAGRRLSNYFRKKRGRPPLA